MAESKNIPLDDEQFRQHASTPRIHCTGGVRHLHAMPDGTAYRCGHRREQPAGNIGDPQFRAELVGRLAQDNPCPNPSCLPWCGGMWTDQRTADGWQWHNKWGIGFDHHFALAWDITMRCNFRCDYCYNREAMNTWPRGREMSTEQILDVCHWLTSVFELSVVSLFGGEPLLHPALPSMAQVLCSGPCILEINTNLSRPHVALDIVRSLQPAARRRFALACGVHAHVPHFDWRRMHAALIEYRHLSPHGKLFLCFVDYGPNDRVMRPEDHAQEFKELGAWWTVCPDYTRRSPVRYT